MFTAAAEISRNCSSVTNASGGTSPPQVVITNAPVEKGGQFAVKRAEIIPGHSELTEMAVNMRGKALLFKTIFVQQKELHRNFERVPDDLTMSDAAALLLKQALTAAKVLNPGS